MAAEQVHRQNARVQAQLRNADGGEQGGPESAVAVSDSLDVSSACPVVITRIVLFDRARAYQYFRWVLEMQDTVPQQKPFGHGEDILLSLLSIRESGGKLNRNWHDQLSGEVRELPEMGVGVSVVNSDHADFRGMYMTRACARLGLPCWDWVRGE